MTRSGRPASRVEDAPSAARLAALSDGVMAIALTLLAFQLHIPAIADGRSAHHLLTELVKQGSEYGIYALTFVIIGMYWLGHHRAFTYLVGHDRRLAWFNLLFLFTIITLPHSSKIFETYDHNRTATVLYAVNLFAGNAASGVMWVYATRAGLVQDGTPPHVVRLLFWKPVVACSILALSVLLAVWSIRAAITSWITLFPVLAVMEHRLDATLD